LIDNDQHDEAVRSAAFAFLDRHAGHHGVISRSKLEQGFLFEGRQVPLVGPQGIFKPAIMRAGIPLSITTAAPVAGRPRPYEDDITEDGLLRYRYRGTDPNHHENVGLRRALQTQAPLIYLEGLVPERYMAQWPVFVVGDDPGTLSVTVAFDDPLALAPEPWDPQDEARRRYVTRLARQRLHQAAFRERVLLAYRRSCSMCRLHHEELLDAAHILPDAHPLGVPAVSNGLALCKLHHAAFDVNIVGVRPDLVLEVRHDVLAEIDGPMLLHGLQGLQGNHLVVPHAVTNRPNPSFLEERYELFRQAG
jgi:putative restriction endonuclease